ncbi:fumarate/nitrate reduction transcriptional regulator [Marinomonas spartinae]|uniref:Fumarate/nitrate reduction transcriptional regulator n=1 Tax=Marinomonas spartinae TaxID=1792290 RepID=A0A1A8T2T2_9GAMM|nr:Crp/Fnr family transcriptional regulator [Marinomonas spartinae]SBS26389.1 fumarate/nitrate reduction transcriptional regulator [Marinomonas spartinae]
MDQAVLEASFRAYFLGLGHDIDWQYLSLSMMLHPVRKGDYLFHQGELANQLYFLHSGLVRYVGVSDAGKEFTQTFVKGPRVIGSTRAMVTGMPVLFGIQALSDVMVISYPWAEFFQQMSQDKGFLASYMAFLEQIFIAKEERESAFVKHSAERRYMDFCADYPELKEQVPLQYIASYIGITPIALSRIRQKLKLSNG